MFRHCDHIGDDHNTDFRNVTEWYLHKDKERLCREGIIVHYNKKLFVAGEVCNQLSWNFNVQEVENNIKMIEYLPGDFFTWQFRF